ncbi:diacylglycerol kinase family protein [Isoptericola sediminis]|uniref:Diacylglycerol kinase n=1 Tax=Isoptericola sediminis TaxID=2733572 RepID=A0A849K2I7_9MICO|nr:diacylglycerol kinase [Isoptericola sediminis]
MSAAARTGAHHVGLVVNPTAGAGRGRVIATVATDRLRRAGHRVSDLSGPDGAATAARLAARHDLEALVVVGGDGMVHLGAGATAGTGTPLGVVPVGTGNDFAAVLGLPEDPLDAVDHVVAALAHGTRRAVDAVEVTGPHDPPRWVAGAVSAGLDAAVSARALRMRHPRGPARYTVATLAELARFRAWDYRLEFTDVVDDGGLALAGEPARATWQGRAAMVTAANVDRIGGGIRVTPHARVDDGLLDVLVAPITSRAAAASIFPFMYAGTHVRRRDVHVLRARAVTISPGPDAAPGTLWPVAHGDGEALSALPLTARAVPGALQVLTSA